MFKNDQTLFTPQDFESMFDNFSILRTKCLKTNKQVHSFYIEILIDNCPEKKTMG